MNKKPESHPVFRGLQWILENRRDPDGKLFSMRGLSLAAGLTAGHLEQILKGRQSPDIGLKVATAFARAANVRTGWLLTGEGPREPFEGEPVRTVEKPKRYPNLEAAIAYHLERWTPATVAAARAMALDSETDRTPPEWRSILDNIQGALKGIEHGKVLPGTPVEDAEDPPPRGRKR